MVSKIGLLYQMFGGWQRRFKHLSTVCGCDMNFQIFFPPSAETAKVPVSFSFCSLV